MKAKTLRFGTDAKRVNVDFPLWMVSSLDREASRLSVTRQSLIKMWLADKIGQSATTARRWFFFRHRLRSSRAA